MLDIAHYNYKGSCGFSEGLPSCSIFSDGEPNSPKSSFSGFSMVVASNIEMIYQNDMSKRHKGIKTTYRNDIPQMWANRLLWVQKYNLLFFLCEIFV